LPLWVFTRETTALVTNIVVRDRGVDFPDECRDRFGIEDGANPLAEAGSDGIPLRPDNAVSVDEYDV